MTLPSPAVSDLSPLESAVDALTLEEKALLVEGVGAWNTNAVDRLGIPALFVTDGPHGVRKVRSADGGFGVSDNEPSTAFPTTATVAGSWDPENARRMGAAIAHECVDLGVDVLLAPGVNIKRHPLCGRNFEYYSEDPLLSGVLGTAFVEGVQSNGVGTSLKHFAANSNENYRFVGDSIVDERALREIYLRQFERVVREAKPATVMCAYNAIGGVFSSDNRALLTGILREEWGFQGAVMTDWGATHDRVAALHAGCDLDMPGEVEANRRAIQRAVADGRLPMSVLDTSVRRILRLIEDSRRAERPREPHDPRAHAALAEAIAADSAVLLQNDGILPLSASASDIVVVGEMFERMRFQGAGSSLITPTEIVSPKDAFDSRGVRYTYARGYRSFTPGRDAALEREALDAVLPGQTVLFFGGLSDLEESEGFDRETMALPEAQSALLRALLDTGARVVLVLYAGAPVSLPFAEELSAVLDMYLPGMRGGEATASLLFGEVSPSGRLAESWPLDENDASARADWDRGPQSRYYESIYVGYRFYDAAGTALRYPFGHGLSYTEFEYRDLQVRHEGDDVLVTLDVANVGERDAREVIQLYVRNNRGEVFKAEKELRAFTKVAVPAGETVSVTLRFPLKDLAYWDIAEHGWVLENGEYEVLAAASSRDVRLSHPLRVTTGRESRSPYPASVSADYARPPLREPESFTTLVGAQPSYERPRRLTLETRLDDARGTITGSLMHALVVGRVKKQYAAALALPDSLERDAQVKNTHFLVRMMPYNSLRSMAMASSGAFPLTMAAAIADLAAHRPFRALRRLVSGGPSDAAKPPRAS
ncbi:beta-glucosidase [Microbacterium sp. JZ70]